jgi:hypothetical protein
VLGGPTGGGHADLMVGSAQLNRAVEPRGGGEVGAPDWRRERGRAPYGVVASWVVVAGEVRAWKGSRFEWGSAPYGLVGATFFFQSFGSAFPALLLARFAAKGFPGSG